MQKQAVTPVFKEGIYCDFCRQEVLDAQKVIDIGSMSVVSPRRPVVEAAMLIIPRRHVELVEDMAEEEVTDLFYAVRALKVVCEELYGVTAFNLFTNSGRAAGQQVPHVHFHFYGRSADESINPFSVLNNPDLYKNRPTVSEELLVKRVEELRGVFQKTMSETSETRY